MPQHKKSTSARARRNKTSTRATLRRIEADASAIDTYSAMTLVQLRAAIDVVNASRPGDQQIPKRGNKSELVQLLAASGNRIPDLPPHPPRFTEDAEGNRTEIQVEWHDQTRAWWADVWTSPMVSEWDGSDLHNLFVLALLYDDIWTAETPKQRTSAMSEYRLQRADLGISPYARRRLEWTIEVAQAATARGEARRAGANGQGTPQPTKAADPRLVLA